MARGVLLGLGMPITLPSLQIGAPTRIGAVTVFPVFAAPLPPVDYRLAADAFADGSFEVHESTHTAGRPMVGMLEARNRGRQRVLIIEGDHLVGAKHGLDDLATTADVEPPRRDAAVENDSAPGAKRNVDASTLVATLRANQFHLARTAAALAISRTHLDALIAASSSLRKAKDLGAHEIAACATELDDDVDAMAAKLEVSPRGLRLRMRQLGL